MRTAPNAVGRGGAMEEPGQATHTPTTAEHRHRAISLATPLATGMQSCMHGIHTKGRPEGIDDTGMVVRAARQVQECQWEQSLRVASDDALAAAAATHGWGCPKRGVRESSSSAGLCRSLFARAWRCSAPGATTTTHTSGRDTLGRDTDMDMDAGRSIDLVRTSGHAHKRIVWGGVRSVWREDLTG